MALCLWHMQYIHVCVCVVHCERSNRKLPWNAVLKDDILQKV